MVSLRMTQAQHEYLKGHLFPGDSLEAVALVSCGRFCHESHNYLMISEILPIPHELCEREEDHVRWPTGVADEFLDIAAKKGHGIVKLHSHPGYYRRFSEVDDISDNAFFDAVYGWSNDQKPHGSVVMLPDGSMFGRAIMSDLRFDSLSTISVIGRDIKFFNESASSVDEKVSLRDIQAFGKGTVTTLSKLKVAVVGCSGTGSIVSELLYRLKVGKLNTTDHDTMELKNLNRVLGSKRVDAQNGKKKVHMMQEHLDAIDLGVDVKVFDENLFDSPSAIAEVISSDIIVGCVDKVDAKQLLNHISTYYICPYVDVGVKLESDGKGGVDEISGSINYVFPGGPSMISRGAYSLKMLETDSLSRADPETYKEMRKEGYMVDVDNPSPAVISVNMLIASLGVNDILARVHGFRYSGNEDFDITMFSLSEWDMFHKKDDSVDKYLNKSVGLGNIKPFLGMLELNKFNNEFD